MKQCLLCEESLSYQLSLQELFLMKREEEWLCESCRIRFEKVGNEVCSSCCKKGQKGMCEDCTTWKKNGKEVCHRALYYYNEEMKDYFRRYKFQGDQLLGYLFAKEIYLELKKYKGYSIVPIPLSQERKEKRGFNQVTAMLDFASLPYCQLLKKRDTQAQSQKNRKERLELKQSFDLINHQTDLSDLKIILVDDIYTTGATIERAKEILNGKGVKEIKSFSLAR